MPTLPLESKHKYFFDWFEDKRKKDGLYYSVRTVDRRYKRLCFGYIFLGSNYIAIPLVDHNDVQHQTASVQFVYGDADNSYCIEVVSRNLANPKYYKDFATEKEFCRKVIGFINLFYKYAEENGGRALSSDENTMLFSGKHSLDFRSIKEPLLIAHQSHHRPDKEEYEAKLYFNEPTPDEALEKFYAFWKEYGIPYWKEYFKDPTSTVNTINNSLKKIDHSLAQCDWPRQVF